ncbi:MAG: hypothetical protein OXT67_01045 [Zetaproteobacteria bacterium]|nr:hypothetical protein [Zetaproteobacteria bacterium]
MRSYYLFFSLILGVLNYNPLNILLANSDVPTEQTHQASARHWLDLLPQELMQPIALLAMHTDPEHMEPVASINAEAKRTFLRYREAINPYKYQIEIHKEAWIAAATHAAMQGEQPEHLQNFLRFEQQQLTSLLRHKESALTRSQDWKRHGASLIAMYPALIYTAESSVEEALATTVLGTSTLQDFKNLCSYIFYGVSTGHLSAVAHHYLFPHASITSQLTVLLGFGLLTTVSKIYRTEVPQLQFHTQAKQGVASTQKDNRSSHWHQAYAALIRAAQASDVGSTEAVEKATHAALCSTASEVHHLLHQGLQGFANQSPQTVGKIAYRVGQSYAWLTLLDPKKSFLQRVYNAAWGHLIRKGAVDPAGWFDSAASLNQKIQAYFGPGSMLGHDQNGFPASTEQYNRRYAHVKWYVQQLQRIQKNIATLESIGR